MKTFEVYLWLVINTVYELIVYSGKHANMQKRDLVQTKENPLRSHEQKGSRAVNESQSFCLKFEWKWNFHAVAGKGYKFWKEGNCTNEGRCCKVIVQFLWIGKKIFISLGRHMFEYWIVVICIFIYPWECMEGTVTIVTNGLSLPSTSML